MWGRPETGRRLITHPQDPDPRPSLPLHLLSHPPLLCFAPSHGFCNSLQKFLCLPLLLAFHAEPGGGGGQRAQTPSQRQKELSHPGRWESGGPRSQSAAAWGVRGVGRGSRSWGHVLGVHSPQRVGPRHKGNLVPLPCQELAEATWGRMRSTGLAGGKPSCPPGRSWQFSWLRAK